MSHELVGRKVSYIRQEKPKGKRKLVDVKREGVVEDVTMMGGQEVATVAVASLFNGGMAISEIVNTNELTVM